MKKIKVRSLVTRHSLFKTILLHDHSTMFVLEKSALPIIYFPCITASASSTVWTFCTESCFSKSSFGRGSACIFVSYSRKWEDILTPSFNVDETRVTYLRHLAHLHTICLSYFRHYISGMRSSRVVRVSGCQCHSRISPGFDPSILRADTVESEGRQMKLCWIMYIKNKIKCCIYR